MSNNYASIDLKCTCGTNVKAEKLHSYDARVMTQEFNTAHMVCSIKKALEETPEREPA